MVLISRDIEEVEIDDLHSHLVVKPPDITVYEEAYYVSWELIDEICKEIARAIEVMKGGGSIGSLYGIPRGGLILGVKLSHLTGIPLKVSGPVQKGDILIDDICETGKTLDMICRMAGILPCDVHIFVGFCADAINVPQGLSSTFAIAGYGHTIDKRLVFPWER